MLSQKIPVRLLTKGKTIEVDREPGMTAGKLLDQVLPEVGEDAAQLAVYDGCRPLAPDAPIDPMRDQDLAVMELFVGG